MNLAAKYFMDLLKLHGHDGDPGCMMMIEEQLTLGVAPAVKHYSNFLPKVIVKKITAPEVTKLVKQGYRVWTPHGIISPSKYNVPMMNGVLLLNDHIEKYIKGLVIIAPP